MWKKLIVSIFCVVVLVPHVTLAQEATVSFDGSSADIAGQPTTRTPGPWNADDAVWSTTDEVVPAIGSQASFKAAIAQAGTAQRRVGEAHTNGHVFVGGGSTNAEGAAGHAPSPWANIIGFDTTSFDDSFALSEISVTLRNRIAADTLDVRWFVEAGGKTYVSEVVAAGVGTTATEVTLADTMAIEWFAFDNNANIEIDTALGSSVGSPIFTDVDYVGIHEQLTYTTLGNWHGAFVPQFSATARFYGFPTEASRPDPADGATDVLRDAVLGWTPGEFAATHDVYLGTIFADVNEASRTDPRGVLARQDQTATTYDPPGGLDFGQTYYWRVDEVNAPPTSTIYKGRTWSFTVEPIAYPIEDVNATASSANKADEGPENTVNGSGLDDDDLHSSESTAMWLSSALDPNAPSIQYEFDKVHKLHQMQVWNYNSSVEPLIGFGVREAVIDYSADGATWTTLGTTHEFARAPGGLGYASETTIDFGGAPAKYVRITANSNWGGIVAQSGLSEVRFLSIPVFAEEPSPDPGATDVGVDTTLGFKAGREAAKHDVYLSTDEQAVLDGNAPVVTVTEPSYAASLDLANTYYWRVDEVNDAETPTTWQGEVWNLSTQEYIVVDDFESYNDIEAGQEGSNLIYVRWLDGFDNPAANGSTIGYTVPFQPTMETSTVFDGSQSVPFEYNNTLAPHSEVTANIANLGAVQDWTKHGIKALTLRFYGDPNNSTNDQMYVKINGAKVAYDGDAESLWRVGWQMWYIDLASVGANLSNITELAIGFERVGAFGGQGLVLLDGIRLYSYDRQLVTPVEPDNANLAAHWQFDGNLLDSSGNGLNGTLMGTPAPGFSAGKLGQALDTTGVDGPGYVTITGYTGILGAEPFSITAWINTGDVEGTIVGWGSTAAGTTRVEFRVSGDRLRCESSGNVQGDTTLPDNEWVHVAVTVKAGAMIDDPDVTLYLNGQNDTRVSTGSQNPLEMAAGFDVTIGRRHSDESRWFDGLIDDVRIYNYELSQEEVASLAGRIAFDKPF